MNVTDAIKEALAVVPRFAQDFVNILVGPRSYAATGAVFNAGKFKEALVLLAVSLVVTLVAKGSMMAFTGSPLPVLAADAIWKFVVVLVVSLAIWISWRILGVAKAPGAYIVAGFYYFGVFSVLSHLILLVTYRLGHPGSSFRLDSASTKAVFVVLSGFLLIWMLVAWQSYKDYSSSSNARSLAALVLAGALSVPALLVGLVLRNAILSQFVAPSVRY